MLRREASSWLARLQSNRDPEVERGFARWYADPANAAAFDRVKQSYGTAAVLRLSGQLASAEAPRGSLPDPSRFALGGSLAAAVATIVLIAVLPPPELGTEAIMLQTNIGEIREVKLSDGSTVTLDSDTRLMVDVGRSRRHARLKAGRARFNVAVAAQPFLIRAGSAQVTASQAIVDVQLSDQQGRVDVLAGAATVREAHQTGAKQLALHADQAVVANPGTNPAATNASPARDWPSGMLTFSGTPIRDAVVTANRYSDQRIVIGDDVGQYRVSGAFHVGDTAGLAKALAAAFHLQFIQAQNGNYILSEATGSATK